MILKLPETLLISILDAFGQNPGAILVNVAPRNGNAKKWENGTPFGYFWYNNILVVASIDGFTLSLVKKLKITDHIMVLDIAQTLDKLISENMLQASLKDYIVNTQFRSYDFVPQVGAYLLKHKELPGQKYDISQIPDMPHVVWWIDNFGNCKTTLFLDEVEKNNDTIITAFGTLPYFSRLKDVPDKTLAIITGSSGIGNKRFLEIVAQGLPAAEKLNISAGDKVCVDKNY